MQDIFNAEIFTVFKSLQDEYVAKNLELDLGSLPQFLDLTAKDTQYASRRVKAIKKYDQAKDVVSDEDEDNKKVNPKRIVDELFREVFKQDLEQFQQENSAQKLEKVYKFQEVDVQKKKVLKQPAEVQRKAFEDVLTSSSKDLKLNILDNQVKLLKPSRSGSRPHEESQNNSIQKNPEYKKKQFFKQPSKLPMDIIDLEQLLSRRLENLIKLKIKFYDFAQQWNQYYKEFTQQQLNTFSEYQQVNLKKHDLQQEFHHYQNLEARYQEIVKQIMYKNKQAENETVIILKKNIIVRNKEIHFDHLLYLAFQSQPYTSAQKIEFFNCNLSDSTIKIILLISEESNILDTLNITNFHESRYSLHTHQQLLQTLPKFDNLKLLKLSGLGITTKMFIELALVIHGSIIEHLCLANNLIDSNAYDAIETLLKYMKKLNYLDMHENPISQTDDIDPITIKKPKSIKLLHDRYKGKKHIKI